MAGKTEGYVADLERYTNYNLMFVLCFLCWKVDVLFGFECSYSSHLWFFYGLSRAPCCFFLPFVAFEAIYRKRPKIYRIANRSFIFFFFDLCGHFGPYSLAPFGKYVLFLLGFWKANPSLGDTRM